MTLEIACPTCHSEFAPKDGPPDEELPPDGAVAVCLHCSEVSVWTSSHGWTRPDAEHRKFLLTLPAVVDSLVEVQMFQQMIARDTEKLTELLNHMLTHGSTIADIAAAIIEAGFHRHPEDGEDD